MNTGSKALSQTLYGSEKIWHAFLSRQLFGLILAGLFVFFSGLGVVYTRYLNRRLYIDTQVQLKTQQALQSEYSQLLLEKSTWMNQIRIEEVAHQKLGLERPNPKDTILIE